MTKTLKTPVEKNGFPYWILLLPLIPLISLFVYLKKKRSDYVLFSNTMPVLRIDEENPLFGKVRPKNKTTNTNEMKYVHYYIKKKNNHNDKHHYAFRKTKTLLK